jgi:ribonuclease P/MRP protein subunit RPP40
MFMFADDSKLYKCISSNVDCQLLQQSCQNVLDWTEKWLMKLNTKKCNVLSINKNKNLKFDFDYGFNVLNHGFVTLDHEEQVKDLGVLMDRELSFSDHINEKIGKAYQMLGIINRNFSDVDKSTFLLLYISLVRSNLEYANSVWSPFKHGLIESLEKVQKRATRMIKKCSGMSYKERLMFLKLPTLRYRRLRGDMIEVFKILNGIYDVSVVPKLNRSLESRTRGNVFKLAHEYIKHDVRKYSFCVRVINTWNSLPDYVVTSLSVNSFKNNLDKHWMHEDLYYNWEANVPGVG